MPEDEKTTFLSSLLYHIYYCNIPLEYLLSSEKLTFYLIRLLALSASEDTLKLFPIDLKLISFCLKNFDEGAYRILQLAQKAGDPTVKELLYLVERKLVPENEVAEDLERCRAQVKKSIKNLQKHFEYSEEQIERFVRIFGLYDHQVPKEAWSIHKHKLLDKKLTLKASKKAFHKAIDEHLQALSHAPNKYVEGMQQITYVLPTAGKDLSLLAWIPSMTDALEGFCSEFNLKNPIPIYVFDQSEPSLFKKNAAFCKAQKGSIIHLGTEEVLQHARKLGIEKLLETDSDGRFGYGGARNAAFLIIPRIQNSTIIHMGDDDLHVPYCTPFSDALFAYNHKNEYFSRFGWVKGRHTTWTETSFNLRYVLEKTRDILLQHAWQSEPFRHGMSGLLTKPKLCLNVPFGQEEAYLLAMNEYLFDLRQPMLHLSGYRLPKANIPQNRLSGLAQFLESHYRYSIGAMLVSDLLDPLNYYKRSSLPWNKVKKNFTSLQDAISYICKPEVIKQMQRQFKKNMQTLKKSLDEYASEKKENLATYHLGVLELQDIDKALEPYKRFPKEVEELKKLFTSLTKDYQSFKELLAGPNIACQKNMPITHSLHLLRSVIEGATFQKALKPLTSF